MAIDLLLLVDGSSVRTGKSAETSDEEGRRGNQAPECPKRAAGVSSVSIKVQINLPEPQCAALPSRVTSDANSCARIAARTQLCVLRKRQLGLWACLTIDDRHGTVNTAVMAPWPQPFPCSGEIGAKGVPCGLHSSQINDQVSDLTGTQQFEPGLCRHCPSDPNCLGSLGAERKRVPPCKMRTLRPR